MLSQLARFTDTRTRHEAVSRRAKRGVNQAMLTLALLEDFRSNKYRDVSWGSAAVLVGSVLYLFNPRDVIPDVIPIVGRLDDTLVMQIASRLLRKDLMRYCEFKGYDPKDYFGLATLDAHRETSEQEAKARSDSAPNGEDRAL
jgi:uncharacterized membrane protein YkvA (DUF1232 family)